MRAVPQSIFWGFLPGLVTSCIGAYKDTLYEEFEPFKIFSIDDHHFSMVSRHQFLLSC